MRSTGYDNGGENLREKLSLRTNYIKTKIDNTLENNTCMLSGNRDETIAHLLSECSNVTSKEYKSRYDFVGKVIH